MEAGSAFRVTSWIIGGLAGLFALAGVILLGVNRSDEPASADASRLQTTYLDRPALPGAVNAYVAHAALASGHADRRAARSEAVPALVAACSETAACEEALRAGPGALAEWRSAEAALLEGYAGMLAAEGWQGPAVTAPGAPVPDFSAVLEAQLLYLLSARQHAVAGDAGAVRDALERDLVFWRRMMASSDSLLTRMVSVTAVERHLQLGQLALRELPSGLALEAVPSSWTRPLSAAERSLMQPVAGEWQMVQAALLASVAPGAGEPDTPPTSRLARPLLQPQATLNRVAGNLMELATVSSQPYPELAERNRSLGDANEQAGSGLTLYNPIGNALAGSQAHSAGAYAGYIARCADLEGLRRATLLVATLRGRGLPPDAMPDALRGAELRNPYDDAAFGWDPTHAAVVFEGLAEGDRGRYTVAF